jgi:hypothetical protein
MLRRHGHIQQLREKVANECASSGGGAYDYFLSGWQGVPKYFGDYSTLLTAGYTGNLAVTYLGSYSLRYEATKLSGRKVVVRFHVENTSSVSSATHPPVIGYTRWWSENIGQPLDSFFSSGPMSPTQQNFDWSETILLSPACGSR